MPKYLKVKTKGEANAKPFIIQVSDNHTDDSAKSHVEQHCPGVEVIGIASQAEVDDVAKPDPAKVPQPTAANGKNPAAPVGDSAGPTPPPPNKAA